MFKYLLKTPQNPYLDFRIESGKFQGIELKTSQISPCMEPSCNCANIYFTKITDYQTDEYFALDVEERKIRVYKNNKPSHNDLTDALESEISEADWEDIYQFYFNLKISLCEMVEPEKVNIVFTNEELKNIEEGIVFPFHEIFPWAMKFMTDFEEETFLMFDYYCLRPNCNCKETLFFIESGQNQNHFFYLSFDYNEKKWELDQVSESFSKEKAEQILEKIKTELEEQLLLYVPTRHQRMRRILEVSLRRQLEEKARLEADSKIGRNDLCPCGSGKKYKNCHG